MKRVIATAALIALAAGCAGTSQQKEATATANLEPRSGSQVRGTITFTQTGPDIVRVSGEVTGHTKGPKGFHIHAVGDCSDPKAMSAGGHFNPAKHKHGGPYDPSRHSGDLGNLNFNDKGVARVNFVVGDISVSSSRPDGIIGKAVVVHMDRDDMKTDPTGNAGGRAACGIIRQ
ncbi:MAG: superoxide dismutase family protein [Burkholderiales bacterium]